MVLEAKWAAGQPIVVPFHEKGSGQFSKPNPGRTCVFSTRTEFRFCGSSPRYLRIVGATCEVATGVLSTLALMDGFDTSNPTPVSLYPNPPCSAFFALDLV
jgi:hypothetical protein